jgi:hypothetical protein
LISARTCAAAVPPWAPALLPGEEAGGAAWELAAPVAGAVWPGDGEPEREGDGLVPVGCARAVTWRGGTVTTAGGTTTVMPAALAAQEAVPAAPHPAAMVRESTVAWPDAWLAENTPRAR